MKLRNEKEYSSEQKKKKDGLPDELWAKILEDVDNNSVTAFACVCKQLRRVQQDAWRKTRTKVKLFNYHPGQIRYPETYKWVKELSEVSEDWCHWAMNSLVFEEVDWSRQVHYIRNCILRTAAFWGHLNVLKHWAEHTPSFSMDFACLGGHLEVVKYLKENGICLDAKDSYFAALGGHLEVLKYLREEIKDWDEEICAGAAAGGHLEVLKYLCENGCSLDEDTCSGAARGGHLELLKCLHESGCPWDEWTCWHAARGGHLEVLKYAHKNQCPLVLDEVFEDICSASALGGNVEVLKYLRKNGFEPDNDYTSNLFCAACKRGHLELLRYIYENEKPFLDHFDDVYDFWMGRNLESVVEGGHVEILKYFRGKKEKAFEYTSEIIGTYAVHGGHFAMVKYLHEDGCTLGYKTLEQAVGGGYFEIKEGDFEVLKYLHENGCPWGEWTCDALVEKYRKMKQSRYYSAGQSLAAKGSDYAVAKYLTDKRCPGYENLKSMFTERDKKRQRAILQQQAKCSSSS